MPSWLCLLFHHFRHHEKSFERFGRVGENIALDAAVRYRVVTQAQLDVHDIGQRFDIVGINLGQLFDEFHNISQFDARRFQLRIIHFKAREARHFFYGVQVHDLLYPQSPARRKGFLFFFGFSIPAQAGIHGSRIARLRRLYGMLTSFNTNYMPTGLLKDIADACPKGVRLLGVDLGTKTIGLALSDAGQGIATPLTTIKRTKFGADIVALGKIVREYEVGGFVFGWPLNMDGTAGPSCERVRSFIDEMKNYPQELGIKQGSDLWIALVDERLTTSAAQDFLSGERAMQPSKRKDVVDALAAQTILSGALGVLKATYP